MVKYFENINTQAVNEHILYRMGYKKGITTISNDDLAKLNEGIAEARRLCVLKGAYAAYKIAARNSNFVKLDNGIIFESAKLTALLSGSDEIYLLAGTAGAEVVSRASEEIEKGNAALAVIIDATASETADSVLDYLQEFIDKQLLRQGKKLTSRFSPGYGDLDLSAQKAIHEALDLSKIGIQINDRHILMPEKSVLAIAGIRAV